MKQGSNLMRHRYKSSHLNMVILSMLLGVSSTVNALDSSTVSTSAISPDCLDYKVTGVCYLLLCDWKSCKVEISVRVKHYVPDAVVTSYASTGNSPWVETAAIGTPIIGAKSGGDAVTSQANENNIAKFNNVDVIGHPNTIFFNGFVSQYGFSCAGASWPYKAYFVSTLDTLGWRYNIPELVYPEALVPGMREVGSRLGMNLWGNIYPRGGFSHQVDGYKSAAVVAQRAGDIVTRTGQPHVYTAMVKSKKDNYWPAGALKEGDASTGKWQELTPILSQTCKVFPDSQLRHTQAQDEGYAWTLWRPYSCCQRRGEIFLSTVSYE